MSHRHLPIEILGYIFTLRASDYYYLSDVLQVTPTVPSWVNVSYVSHRWRNVALACPSLWAYIFIVSPRWTEELLARSRDASLRIFADFRCWQLGDHSWLFPCLEKLMMHIERIQELRLVLCGASGPHTPRFLSHLSSRAPRLQNLQIVKFDTSLRWPSVLFGGDPPALHTLHLVNCPAPLQLFNPSTLMSLYLDGVPDRSRLNMEEFLAALSRMHNIIDLYLEDALASAIGFLSSAVFKAFKKINIPHLSRLFITAPLSVMNALLSCVNIPLQMGVRLESFSEDHSFNVNGYPMLCSLLTQRYSIAENQASSIPTILSFSIECTDFDCTRLTLGANERDFHHQEYGFVDCSTPLVVELNGLDLTDDDGCIVANVLCSLPLSNVQTLYIVDPIFSPSFWRRTLGHLQGVRYIKMSDGNMGDLSVLGDIQNQDISAGDYGQRHVLAPQLEELELVNITFVSDPNLEEFIFTPQRLFDALSERQGSQGCLTMKQCEIDGQTVDQVMMWGDGDVFVVGKEGKSKDEGNLEQP